MRCFIFDNHRPFHLENIHSRHNVVIFDDGFDDNDELAPVDGSDLSSGFDRTTDDDDDEDDDDEDDLVSLYTSPISFQQFHCI